MLRFSESIPYLSNSRNCVRKTILEQLQEQEIKTEHETTYFSYLLMARALARFWGAHKCETAFVPARTVVSVWHLLNRSLSTRKQNMLKHQITGQPFVLNTTYFCFCKQWQQQIPDSCKMNLRNLYTHIWNNGKKLSYFCFNFWILDQSRSLPYRSYLSHTTVCTQVGTAKTMLSSFALDFSLIALGLYILFPFTSNTICS